MDDLKTYLNPVVPLGRLAFSIFFCGLTGIIIYFAVSDFKTSELTKGFTTGIGATIFGAFSLMFFKSFITETKNYLIQDNTIGEFNALTFKTKIINKFDVKGFSTSTVPYRIGNFQQVTIYLKDGSKIEIMQFAYFNFKHIKPTLIGKNYNYLGHEHYIWKWPNSRVYAFDK
jgi:hypothetical protein